MELLYGFLLVVACIIALFGSVALALIIFLAIRHNYKVWLKAREFDRKTKELSDIKWAKPRGWTTDPSQKAQGLGPNDRIQMQSGKNGLRWGGNTYTVKKK